MTALKVGRVTDDRQLIQDGIHEYGELTVPGGGQQLRAALLIRWLKKRLSACYAIMMPRSRDFRDLKFRTSWC